MVVLMYTTGSCCHYNEFKGIFKDEETAIAKYLEYAKKHRCTLDGEDYVIERPENGVTYSCYCIFKNGNRHFDGYLDIEEVELDELH